MTDNSNKTPLGEMTDDEAAALFLAWCRTEQIQYFNKVQNWVNCLGPIDWRPDTIYRVKPSPKVEQIRIYGNPRYGTWDGWHRSTANKVIILTEIDGEIQPEARVEKL